jgi:hypothetical protein
VWQGPDDRQRVLGVCHARHLDGFKWKGHAAVAVPCADSPALVAAQAGQFPDGFLGLMGLDPDGREGGLDELAELKREGSRRL